MKAKKAIFLACICWCIQNNIAAMEGGPFLDEDKNQKQENITPPESSPEEPTHLAYNKDLWNNMVNTLDPDLLIYQLTAREPDPLTRKYMAMVLLHDVNFQSKLKDKVEKLKLLKEIVEEAEKDMGPSLIKAIRNNQTDRALELINTGVNLDYQPNQIASTPLMIAANQGNIEIVKTLLEKGADANLVNSKNQTALIIALFNIASSNSNQEVVSLLIEHSNLDIQDNDGYTALIWAILFGNYDAAKELIDAGANLALTTNKGKTALDISRDRGTTEISNLIEQKLIKPKASRWGKMKRKLRL